MNKEDQLSFSYYFEDLSASPLPEIFEKYKYPWEPIGARILDPKGEIKGDVHQTAIIKGKVDIGEGTVIHPYVVIEGPVVIGKKCEIRSFALLRAGTNMGDGCVVGHACEVKNSMIFSKAKLASHTFVGDSIVGKGARIGSGTIITNRRFDQKDARVVIQGKKIATGLDKCGAIIGDYVRLGANCMTAPGAMIGKYSWIYGGTAIYGAIEKDKLIKLRQTADIIDKERVVLSSLDKKGNV